MLLSGTTENTDNVSPWRGFQSCEFPSIQERRVHLNATQRIPRTFASVMKEKFYDVEIKPTLQPLEGEFIVHKTTTTKNEARLDIEAKRRWDFCSCTLFFDVKISTGSLELVLKMSTGYINFENLKRNSNTSPEL